MVFCYQNCSDLLSEKNVLVIEKKLLKFKAEDREFAKFLRSREQFIQTVKGQNNFWLTSFEISKYVRGPPFSILSQKNEAVKVFSVS